MSLRFSSHEKFKNSWILGIFEQHSGVSFGSHGSGFGIEKYAVVADGEDACQLMGYHYYGCAETIP